MPAMRATLKASPFLREAERRAGYVSGAEKCTVAVAVAVLREGGFELMLMMCAVEVGVRWGSC